MNWRIGFVIVGRSHYSAMVSSLRNNGVAKIGKLVPTSTRPSYCCLLLCSNNTPQKSHLLSILSGIWRRIFRLASRLPLYALRSYLSRHRWLSVQQATIAYGFDRTLLSDT